MKKVACQSLVAFSIVLFSLWLSTHSVSAQVRLSEIMPKPSTGADWIELHNRGPTAQSLYQWKLYDVLTNPSQLIEFDQNAVLKSGEYLVIEVNNKLNNDGDGVKLVDNTGQTIDSFEYHQGTPDLSWYYDVIQQSWREGVPTRGTSNPDALPTPSPSATPPVTPAPSPELPSLPSQWLASEVMSCPLSDQTEWLELYNPDPLPHTVENLVIRDAQNNQKQVTFQAPAFGFGLITWEGSLLNNTGDSLHLMTESGVSLVKIDLPACQTGTSFIWTGTMWMSSTSPTPGYLNSAPPPSPLASPSPISSPPITTPTPSPNTTPSPTASVTPSGMPQALLQTLTLPSLKVHSNGNLKISGQSPNPSAAPSQNPPRSTNSPPSTQTFWPFLSVIMGGIILITAGTYDLNFTPFFQWLAGMD